MKLKIILLVFGVSNLCFLSAQTNTVVWHIKNIDEAREFKSNPRIYKLLPFGLEKKLPEYKYLSIDKDESLRHLDTIQKFLLSEAVNFPEEERRKRVRKIVFNLRNYNLQLFGFENRHNKTVHLTGFLDAKFSDVDYVFSQHGGGIGFFRIQVNYVHNKIKNYTLVINQDF